MAKKIYFVEFDNGVYEIPEGFIYASVMNGGTTNVNLTLQNGDFVLLPPSSTFDLPEDTQGYEAIQVSANSNKTSIYYKMK